MFKKKKHDFSNVCSKTIELTTEYTEIGNKISDIAQICRKFFYLYYITYFGILFLVARLPGGFHFRKEVVQLSTYEEFSIIIGVAMLVVTILMYVDSKKDTKK